MLTVRTRTGPGVMSSCQRVGTGLGSGAARAVDTGVSAGPTAIAARAAHGFQRRQSHAEVRRVHRDAMRAGAEDRVVAVETVTRRATAAGLALVAPGFLEPLRRKCRKIGVAFHFGADFRQQQQVGFR